MINETTHGGPRRNAGRPRKGEQPRVPISFSVDLEIKQMAGELRKAGVPVGGRVEGFIRALYHQYFTL